ncbi:MAG: hypothetical protein ACI935_000161 [Moritella dasanensis]|jgi:hypothetical protein
MCVNLLVDFKLLYLNHFLFKFFDLLKNQEKIRN